MSREPVFYGTPDDNITDLVFALNDLPGIVTMASCGGHPDPGPTQRPEGRWFVSFEVRETWAGLNTLLGVIALTPHVTLETMAKVPLERGGCLQCCLRGQDVEPDMIWARLASAVLGAHHA